jgi:hypothetical protein
MRLHIRWPKQTRNHSVTESQLTDSDAALASVWVVALVAAVEWLWALESPLL